MNEEVSFDAFFKGVWAVVPFAFAVFSMSLSDVVCASHVNFVGDEKGGWSIVASFEGVSHGVMSGLFKVPSGGLLVEHEEVFVLECECVSFSDGFGPVKLLELVSDGFPEV